MYQIYDSIDAENNGKPKHVTNSELKVQLDIRQALEGSPSLLKCMLKELKNVELTKRKITFAYRDGGLRSITTFI